MILTNKKERSRFLRFAMVGIIGAIIDFLILNLLHQIFNIPILIAQAASFSVAVISNFTWNRLWTYPESRARPIGKQLVQFVTVSLIGLAIRTLIFDRLDTALVSFSARFFSENFILKPDFIGHNASLAIVIIIILFWNFFVNRFWTYNGIN